MSKLEIVMWCIAYALGADPPLAEIKRAKHEVLSIQHKSVKKVMKSIDLLLPHMSEREISLFHEHFCICALSAVSYRVSMLVKEHSASGYSICPRCQSIIEIDYQSYCGCCGQHLAWQ